MLIYCLLPKNLYVCSIYAKPNDLETDMLPCFKKRNIKHYMQKRYELSEHIYKFIDFCFTFNELLLSYLQIILLQRDKRRRDVSIKTLFYLSYIHIKSL